MELYRLSENNIIDTTNEMNIQKYNANIRSLINQAKSTGTIDKFVIIRNDDFFPENYEWIANCNGEYRELVRLIYPQKAPVKKSFFHAIFSRKDESIQNNISYDKLMLYYPVEFRSTKHFTVNTALGLTGEYNLVKSDRKFTIIDDINNFLNSGYAYSLSEKDAYLDVTHEPLKISEDAIILISIDTYNQIKENKDMLPILAKRKFLIYKGDLTTAINMILSENGILPIRSEYEYDDEVKQIIQNSLKNLCDKYDLEYDRPHGMTGHFTSYIDQYVSSSKKLIEEFVKYINSYVGYNLIDMNKIIQNKNLAWKEYIENIGIDVFKEILNKFNELQKDQLLIRKKGYLNERKQITSEVSKLFKDTIQLIRQHEKEINFISDDNNLTKTVLKFYLSFDLESQIEAAIELNKYFNEFKEQPIRI